MKITVVAVGKIKEKFFADAVSEYRKRLGRYCKLEILQVADEKTPDGVSEALEKQIKDREGERILSHMMSSEEMAQKMERLGVEGRSQVVFVIGGSLGLSEAVIRRADEHLSFSKMTFPHQLMRVILLEQIYRSYRIMTGGPYHK